MNKSNFNFIERVAFLVSRYSQFPDDVCFWIGCQFALESSFGESSLAKSNKNYCGMKNPIVRISCAKHAGDCNYHWAQYFSLVSCVVDYLLCLQYHRPVSVDYDTISRFSSFVRKFYCPEKDYIDKINTIYSQFKNYKNEQSN